MIPIILYGSTWFLWFYMIPIILYGSTWFLWYYMIPIILYGSTWFTWYYMIPIILYGSTWFLWYGTSTIPKYYNIITIITIYIELLKKSESSRGLLSIKLLL